MNYNQGEVENREHSMRHISWRFYDIMNVHVFQHQKLKGVEKSCPKNGQVI